MTSKFFNIKHAAALLAAAAAMGGILTSCVTDERLSGGDGPVPTSGELTIRIAVPDNSTPATRALTTADEYDVNEITVLAFDADDQEFHGRYSGSFSSAPTHQSGTEAGATMTFHVSLPVGEFDLMVVANADAMLDAASATLVEGTAQTTVLEAIRMTMGTTGWDVDAAPAPLPMWGCKTGVSVPEDFTGTDATLSSAIRLTRMVAKVDIKLGADLVAADKFELETVRVYNYVEQGRLIPNLGLGDWDEGDDLALNDAPTLPTGFTKADAASNEYLEYTFGTGETSLVRSIYLFESPAGVSPVSSLTSGMKNTCLIIGGSYNGGPKSWYRIDFTKDTDTNTADDVHNWVYMPILRNNAYFVTVADITDDGFGSASDALGSAPVNINTKILKWADERIHVAATNGIYMLGLSQDAFVFSSDARTSASTDNELIAVTDYSGGWSAVVWDDEAGTAATAASSWLTLSQYSVSAADDPDGTSVRLIATANASQPADRTAWVHFTAGVVTLKVEVTQATPGVRNIGTDPGVIGYVWNPGKPDHMQLTLAKDDGNDANGYVYVAFFKFGSLVAMTSQNKGPFTSADVVAWPTDWATTTDYRTDRAAMEAKFAGATAGTQSLDVVPDLVDKYASVANNSLFPSIAYPADLEMALDDPCDYYFGADGWKTPLSAEMSFLSTDPGYSWSPGTDSVTDPGLGVFPRASVSLPAAGERTEVEVRYQGTDRLYWSANIARNGYGSYLTFDASGSSSTSFTSAPYAKAVRCVQPVVATSLTVTPASQKLAWDAFTTGESVVFDVTADGEWAAVTSSNAYFTITRALNGTGYNGTITVTSNSDNATTAVRSVSITVTVPRATALNKTITVSQGTQGVRSTGNTPGVIGYVWNPGQPDHLTLTMDKDNNNDADGIVYVALFQYGSLVALSSQNNGPFTSTDVVAWPTDWAADRTAMEAKFAGAAAGSAAYGIVPYTSTIPATNDAAQAHGDPCTYYQSQFGDEWKMPTKTETTTFIGGTGSTTSGLYTSTPASGTQPALGNFPAAPGGPYSLPFTGNRTSGTALSQATSGLYWTSTSRDFLTLNSGSSFYGSNSAAYTARAIRCQGPTSNPVGEVIVGDIAWAMTNVAEPGTFAATMDVYDGANQYDFDEAQTVCPTGWRLPTSQDFYDLMAAALNAGGSTGDMTPADAGYYTSNPGWNAGGYSHSGMLVETDGGDLFFPASGTASDSGSEGSTGYYWSGYQVGADVYALLFASTQVRPGASYNNPDCIMSVRCVRDL